MTYLDNLRSFALLLGLVFHSAIVYAESIGYAIQSQDRSEVLKHFCFFVHSFRMPLFFFLSGFFSEMIWTKKGKMAYLQTRSLRLILPFFVGMVLFAPIQYFLVELRKGENFLYPEFFLGFWSGDSFGLSHLWFLYYLIIYCILLPFVPGKDRYFRFDSLSSHFLYFFFVLTTLGFSLFANSIFPKGYKFLEIDPYLFIYNFSFFFAGILAFRNPKMFRDSILTVQAKAIGFICLLILLVFFENLEIQDPLWSGYFWGGRPRRILHLGVSATIAWGFIYFFIEFFKRFFNSETESSIYIRDSSLPIYLIHHPVSLGLGYYLLPLNIDLFPKFCIHLTLVFLISFLIYDSFVKPSPLFRLLLGMRIDKTKEK
jgi:glucan biosynthesis protein C